MTIQKGGVYFCSWFLLVENMKDTHQKFKIVINVSFIIVLLIHVSYIGENLMFPGNPNVRIQRKDLMDIRFPLAFKLCVSRLDDSHYKNYRKYGYKESFDFFRGESLYNASLRGWRGHTSNNSVLGSVKGEMSLLIQLSVALFLLFRNYCKCLFQMGWGSWQGQTLSDWLLWDKVFSNHKS